MKVLKSLKKSTVLWILAITLFTGFNTLGQPPVPKAISTQENLFGLASAGKYENKYFGFSFKFPEGYTVVESEEAKLYSKAGVDVLRNTDIRKSKGLDEAFANQATLFGLLQKPFGSPQNAVIEIIARKQAKGVTANMALLASTSLMTSSTGYKLTKVLPNPKFGGKTFAGAKLDGEFNSVKLTQELYVIMRREYAVYIGVTYSTDEGRTNMIDVLNSLVFIN